MIVPLVLEAIISFPHAAHHAYSRQYLSAYNGYERIFIPALYRYKEAGLGVTANAAIDPLSFDRGDTSQFFVQNPTCFKGEENDFNVIFWNLNKVLEI